MDTDVLDLSSRLNDAMAEGEQGERGIDVEPGVYPGVPMLDYLRWKAVSQSDLGRLIPPNTPAHFRAYKDNPPTEKTEALIIGEAIHCAILEPDDFPVRFIPQIEGDGRTKAVKDAREMQRWQNPGATILGKSTTGQPIYQMALSVRDAVWRHKGARAVLERVTMRELSICWRDPATGILCKARLDGIAPSLGAVVDLKSTISADPDSFARAIRRFGYYRQSAMYLEACAWMLADDLDTGEIDAFMFIAFEKVPPFAVAVYNLADKDIISGGTELAPLMALYARCERENHWPAFSDDICDISMPETDSGLSPYTEGF